MDNELIWHVFEYSIGLIEMAFLYMFLNQLIERKQKIPQYIPYIVLIGANTIVFGLSRIDKFSTVKMVTASLLFMAMAVLFYKARLIIKLFWTAMFIVSMALGEIMLIYVSSYITQIDVTTVALTTNWYRAVFIISSKLLLFIFIKVVGQTTHKSFNSIPTRFFQIMIGVFIISFISVLSIMNIGVELRDNELSGLLLVIIATGILVLTITIYQMFQYLCDYFEKEKQYEIIEYQNEVMIKEALERDASLKEILKIEHDFNNHISCIDMLLQMDKVKRARQYIRDMKINSHDVIFEIKTGNEIADAVINQKHMRAKKHGIAFSVQGLLKENISINAVDLCALISNGLDNAIEANLKIKDKSNRKIQMHMKPHKDYLVIEIINTVNEQVKNLSHIKTTKKDKGKHGFGILNMKQIAKKYGGYLQYTSEENSFNLLIRLKIAEGQVTHT